LLQIKTELYSLHTPFFSPYTALSNGGVKTFGNNFKGHYETLKVFIRETREMSTRTEFCLACWGGKGKIVRGDWPLLTEGELAKNI